MNTLGKSTSVYVPKVGMKSSCQGLVTMNVAYAKAILTKVNSVADFEDLL
jgi:hypothetical protein